MVVTGPPTGAVGLSAFDGLDVAGAAVLVRTGWDAHFGTERYGDPEHPFLATDAAAWLADHGRGAGRHRLGQHRRDSPAR